MSVFDRDDDNKKPRNRGWIFGFVALLLAGNGVGFYGYFNGWFCQWGFGKNCDAPPPPVVFKNCDPKSPQYDAEKCEVRPTVFDTPAPDFENGESCKGQEGYFVHDNKVSKCVPVFYVTDRSATTARSEDGLPLYFDDERSANLSYGSSSVALPIIKKEWGNEESIKVVSRSLRSALESEGFDPDRVKFREATIIKPAPKSAEVSNKSNVLGISGVSDFAENAEESESRVAIRKKFVDELNRQLNPETKTIFLYIHGYNTTFRKSLMTLAHVREYMAAMNGNDDNLARDYGVPIVFSWPTKLGNSDALMKDTWDRSSIDAGVSYFESQIEAYSSAKELQSFFSLLINETNVEQINVIAHSMGNRVLLDVIPQITKNTLLSAGRDVDIQIVHAAADYGQIEYQKLFQEIAGDEKLGRLFDQYARRLNIYLASSDEPLNFSNIAQWTKRTFGKLAVDNLKIKSEDVREYKDQEFGKLRRKAEAAGINFNAFANEDQCRVGLRRQKQGFNGFWTQENYYKNCEPIVVPGGKHITVDVSGYGAREGADGHNYFEDSPMVMADMGCALRGGTEAMYPRRALQKNTYGGVLGIGSKKFWKLVSSVPHDDSCAAANRTYVSSFDYEVVVERIEAYAATVYFDLMKSTLTPVAYTEIQRLAHRILSDGNPLHLQVHGYTDTAGTEKYNYELSVRRASAVKAALVVEGIPEHVIDIKGFGERELAEKTLDDVRYPNNRRAVITAKVRLLD